MRWKGSHLCVPRLAVPTEQMSKLRLEPLFDGPDPEREGLIETPARMARSFEEFFVDYAQDPVEFLQKTFEEIEGYDEMIVLRGIRFER